MFLFSDRKIKEQGKIEKQSKADKQKNLSTVTKFKQDKTEARVQSIAFSLNATIVLIQACHQSESFTANKGLGPSATLWAPKAQATQKGTGTL